MSLRFEPVSLTVSAQRGRELRMGADATSWSRITLRTFGPAEGDKPRATAELSRDGLRELIHVLETLDEELEARRNVWLATEDGQAWSAQKSAPRTGRNPSQYT